MGNRRIFMSAPAGVDYLRTLHVDTKQDETPCVHVLTKDSPFSKTAITRVDYLVVATGTEFEDTHLHYIGTFKLCGGQYMYHVFLKRDQMGPLTESEA
jgi:hypothetical protein